MHTAIIVNPNAGRLRSRPHLLEQLRARAGKDASVHVTRDAAELELALARAADDGANTVAVVGGDGTASMTLTAVEQAYEGRRLPRIAFLRGGTMNTVANSISGAARNRPLDLLARALRAAQANGSSPVRRRPTIRIGDRLGFLFGTGVWSGYLSEYNQARGGQPTPMSAATVLGRALASAAVNGRTYGRMLQPKPLSVEFASGSWATHAYMTVCASTIEHAGLGFRPFHRAFANDAEFQIVAIKGGASEVLRDLPSVWRGRGLRPTTAHDTTTAWAELTADAPFDYAVDGDVCTAKGRLRLELGPTFDFLRI